MNLRRLFKLRAEVRWISLIESLAVLTWTRVVNFRCSAESSRGNRSVAYSRREMIRSSLDPTIDALKVRGGYLIIGKFIRLSIGNISKRKKGKKKSLNSRIFFFLTISLD